LDAGIGAGSFSDGDDPRCHRPQDAAIARGTVRIQAVLVLHADGSYEATDRVDDLNAHRPTTKGRYVFNEDKQQIDWMSGNWKDRIGTYMPHVKGTDFVVVYTKRGPENKTDGTLRCARTAPSQ